MRRKIAWLILFFVLGLAMVLGGVYNSHLSADKAALNDQEQASKDFLDFAVRKIELSRVSGEDVSKKEQADLDSDSSEETYSLESGRLTITENSKAVWQSPSDWWIDNFVLADSNNDGVGDMNLSVWKPGDFGPSKPFWVKGNDLSIKNHFFVFDIKNGEVVPIWQSSNLEAPNCEFDLADIDGDGENDLIAVEGDYSQEPGCNGNYVAVWKWNGWGFSNDWRSEKGVFSALRIEKINGKNYIVADSDGDLRHFP